MKPVAAFFTAFILTLCVLALPLSFGVVEWNMGRTVWGEFTPSVSFSAAEGVPRLTDAEGESLSLPPVAERGLWAAIPAPLKGLWYLFRGQLTAAAALWEATD